MRSARSLTTSILFMIFFAAAHSAAGGADFFQWTDSSGVIHFSDHPYGVPDSVRSAGKLLVRKSFFVDGPTVHEARVAVELPQSAPDRSSDNDSAVDSEPSLPISFSDSPQETNVVVVNSTIVRRPLFRPCSGSQNCRPGHAGFNGRRYIDPSVFDRGSRRYIHR